jgi:hypothetical protein
MADGRRLARQVTTEFSTFTDVVYAPKVAYDRHSHNPTTVLRTADSGAAFRGAAHCSAFVSQIMLSVPGSEADDQKRPRQFIP